MKIIRADDGSIIDVLPLLCQWGITRCNVRGCTEQPNTIVRHLAPDVPLAGFCEMHYQEANVAGGVEFTLEFGETP